MKDKKCGYWKCSTQIGLYLGVLFTICFVWFYVVYDKKADRDENESTKLLDKLIKSALEGTNWRLMNEGVSYRLGMLEGWFRAYEQEEDLLKLI